MLKDRRGSAVGWEGQCYKTAKHPLNFLISSSATQHNQTLTCNKPGGVAGGMKLGSEETCPVVGAG